jgi:hypothetical protein
MHACWILLCMSLKYFLLCILKFLKGICKINKPKGGLEGSMPQPMGGWVCYTELDSAEDSRSTSCAPDPPSQNQVKA